MASALSRAAASLPLPCAIASTATTNRPSRRADSEASSLIGAKPAARVMSPDSSAAPNAFSAIRVSPAAPLRARSKNRAASTLLPELIANWPARNIP